MVDYTFPILVTLAYSFNYLMLYRKNRLVYNILFMGISAATAFTAYLYAEEYIMITIILLALGLVSFIYDLFGIKDKNPDALR